MARLSRKLASAASSWPCLAGEPPILLQETDGSGCNPALPVLSQSKLSAMAGQSRKLLSYKLFALIPSQLRALPAGNRGVRVLMKIAVVAQNPAPLRHSFELTYFPGVILRRARKAMVNVRVSKPLLSAIDNIAA